MGETKFKRMSSWTISAKFLSDFQAGQFALCENKKLPVTQMVLEALMRCGDMTMREVLQCIMATNVGGRTEDEVGLQCIILHIQGICSCAMTTFHDFP